MEDKVFIEATEKEVVNIGFNRHFRKNWRVLLPFPIVTFVVLMVVAVLTPDTWAKWQQIVILLPLTALFLWYYYRLFVIPRRAGKELWRQLKEPKVQ